MTLLHAIAPAVLPIGAVPCNCRVALGVMQLVFCWPRDEKRVDFSARAGSIEKLVKEQLELRRSHSSRIPSIQSSGFTRHGLRSQGPCRIVPVVDVQRDSNIQLRLLSAVLQMV